MLIRYQNELLLLLFLLFKVTITQDIIELVYSRVYNSIYLDIGFGNPPRNGEVEVNMIADYNWVSSFYYSPNKSSNSIYITNNTIYHYSQYSNATLYKDSIFFFHNNEPLQRIDNITFYYINDIVTTHSEFLSFAFKVANSYTSSNTDLLIPFMKSKHLIPKASFALKSNGRYLGDFYLGGIPLTYASTYTYNATIPIIIEDDDMFSRINWGFNLYSISFSNGSSYNVNYQYAYFDIKEEYIFSPKSFINFLKEHILHDYIANSKCKLNEHVKYNRYTFACDNSIIPLLPEMYVNVGKYVFSFTPNEWFDCYGSLCECIFSVNSHCENEWIFGLPFIKNDIIEFDYESSDVKVYSNNKKAFVLNESHVNNKVNKALLIKVIFKYICLLLIINILMNVFISFNKHN